LAAACHFVASLPDYPHSRNIVQPPLIEYDVGDNALRDTIFTQGGEKLDDAIKWAENELEATLRA
jgi:hypothetical protein